MKINERVQAVSNITEKHSQSPIKLADVKVTTPPLSDKLSLEEKKAAVKNHIASTLSDIKAKAESELQEARSKRVANYPLPSNATIQAIHGDIVQVWTPEITNGRRVHFYHKDDLVQ